ncbi:MAG TPA: type I-E CRISPR-associated protein Cse2/CasB [Amycolatopsis sp.]|uniref:type I-E CRISPR-associated protein Cse2/CasB n=1 Tax=Amycolatopsis sp. TaxID=37632 RepID=UPI002B491EDC|nr:type I-E CRISPR-associated protein Cse2/CasB [Amycolatopsis sp.]HKS45437.1 type I-E CRISPR-associated protein Cse2/CasB [Amycolatopsis sp.]
MTAQPTEPNTPQQRRWLFVNSMYRYHDALTADPRQAAEARRVLARLRRSFAGPRQEAEAYDVVFEHDPPEAEQEIWLLVAGLFALHPQPRPRKDTRGSIGTAMRALSQPPTESTTRRFQQLLAVDRNALPHYLRQCVQMLRTKNVAVDYDQLLDDLVVVLGPYSRDEEVRRVRLRWARDYHRKPRAGQDATTKVESPSIA